MKVKFQKLDKCNEIQTQTNLGIDNKNIINNTSKKIIPLEERIKNYKGTNLAKKFSWDEPRGKEIF